MAELSHNEYELLNESIKSLSAEMKEMRILYEQVRRETAAGFVPRDLMSEKMLNFQIQMTALQKDQQDSKISFAQYQVETKTAFEKYIEKQETKDLGKTERFWLRAASIGGLIGVLLSMLNYFHVGGH